MTPENGQKLIEACPKLYQSFKPHAFKCGDGWHDILMDASLKLEVQLSEREDIVAERVFEKYGSLRLELTRHDDELEAIVLDLEARSEHTCEECGAPGKIHTTTQGWDMVRCERCMG